MAQGYAGIVDWSLIPVGQPQSPTVRRGGITVGGRRRRLLAQQAALVAMDRSILNAVQQDAINRAIRLAAAGEWIRKVEAETQKRLLESAFYTALLSEL